MPTADAVAAVARSWVGLRENPPGSNRTTLVAGLDARYGPIQLSSGAWVYRNGYEWCASAIAAWHHEAAGWPSWDLPIVSFYTPADRNVWRQLGRWHNAGQVGDHIYFDWSNDGTVDHVGLVVADLGWAWQTVEGNLGDAVQLVTRPKSARQIAGFGRPDYEATPEPSEDDMTQLVQDPTRLAVYAAVPGHSRRWISNGNDVQRIRAQWPTIGDVVMMSIADQQVLYGPRIGALPEDNGYPGERE